MSLGAFSEDAYEHDGDEQHDRRGPAVDSRPCPGPPHHNPRCCLAPRPRSFARQAIDAVRKVRRRGDRA